MYTVKLSYFDRRLQNPVTVKNTNMQVIYKLIDVPVSTSISIPNQKEIKRTKKTLTKLVVQTRHIGNHLEDFLKVKLQK